MGIRLLLTPKPPNFPKEVLVLSFRRRGTEAEEMAQTGESRSAGSGVLFVYGSLPPYPRLGKNDKLSQKQRLFEGPRSHTNFTDEEMASVTNPRLHGR